MNIDVVNLANDVSNIQLNTTERKSESSCVDYGNVERDKGTRKSSTSSVSSSQDRRRQLMRKNSEVKIEEIFKQLFSPDAKIVDPSDHEFVINLPDFEEVEIPEVRKNEKFTVRRQTSLVKKDVIPPKKILPITSSRKPTNVKKQQNDRIEKTETAAKRIKPKILHRTDTLAFDSLQPQSLIETSAVTTSPFARRNAIPLRRAVSMAQKT